MVGPGRADKKGKRTRGSARTLPVPPLGKRLTVDGKRSIISKNPNNLNFAILLLYRSHLPGRTGRVGKSFPMV